MNRERKDRRKSLAEAARRTEFFTVAITRSQAVWNSVKAQMKTMLPVAGCWQRRSTGIFGATTATRVESRWPQDEEESLFCESLLGLMESFERYDFLKPESRQSSTEAKELEADISKSGNGWKKIHTIQSQ